MKCRLLICFWLWCFGVQYLQSIFHCLLLSVVLSLEKVAYPQTFANYSHIKKAFFFTFNVLMSYLIIYTDRTPACNQVWSQLLYGCQLMTLTFLQGHTWGMSFFFSQGHTLGMSFFLLLFSSQGHTVSLSFFLWTSLVSNDAGSWAAVSFFFFLFFLWPTATSPSFSCGQQWPALPYFFLGQ